MAGVTTVPAQSLECVICHELYNEPKQLSCTHTFCQKCLANLLNFSISDNKLTCPVCRQITKVEDGDVSKLQTNFPIKYLVEDIKSAEQMCTVCDQGARSKAVAYCQTCGVYMCISCLDAHGKFKLNKKHEVVYSEDTKSGMRKAKQLCKKHPQEEMKWVCSTCKVPICFRCMIYHSGPNHEVQEVAEIQKALKEEAKTLQKEADDTVKAIKDHIKVVEEENGKSCTMLKERVEDVIRAFDDTLENLTKQKNELVKKLQKCKDEMTRNLQDMKECDMKLLNDISSARDLITKGAAGFLEGESLVVHQRLCTELRELMNKADCDDKIPRGITEQAESIKFTRSQRQQDLKLGELTLPGMDSEAASANPPRTLEPTHGDKPWKLKKIHSLSTLGGVVSDMAPTPDGRMAVSYNGKGVDLFTVNALQETVLRTEGIQSISFLSDGRCAVTGPDCKFSLYSKELKQVPSPEVKAKRCCYVSAKVNEILILETRNMLSIYRPNKKEIVQHAHKIYCNAVKSLNHTPYYVYTYVHGVRVINERFKEINDVTVDGYRINAVVLEDDSILIGCVEGGCVTVNLYTFDLRHVRTVLQNFKVYGKDFLMAAFSTGEIAICDSRLIHVFRKDYQV